MTRMLPLFAAASLAVLAACSKPAAPGAPPPSASAEAPAADASSTAAKDAVSPSPAPRTPMLAMAYRLGFVLPTDQVRPMMESHQEACERAGPEQCQVTGADARSEGRDHESATLSLRATPAWMRAFRARAEADVRDAGGRIREANTAGEDLSRPIGDAEAAQRVRAQEEARLKELLARRSRHLSDSLAVEQEITRVQNELDAQDSAIGAMRDRVAMQTLTVTYVSAGAAFDGDAAPLARAAHDFNRHMMAVFALLLNLASFLAPLAILALPVVWWARGRRKPAARTARPPAEA